MDANVKSISEVIEMACKGFIPYKKTYFIFKMKFTKQNLLTNRKQTCYIIAKIILLT